MNELRPQEKHPTVHHPERAVRTAYVEPILFLGERMAAHEPVKPRPERPMVQRLAEMAGAGNFHENESYRRLNEAAACDALATERARMAALVVMALVMKSDTEGREGARAYFTEIRERLGQDPIAVPTSIEEHLGLALEYLRD